jgi:hypothetical protein
LLRGARINNYLISVDRVCGWITAHLLTDKAGGLQSQAGRGQKTRTGKTLLRCDMWGYDGPCYQLDGCQLLNSPSASAVRASRSMSRSDLGLERGPGSDPQRRSNTASGRPLLNHQHRSSLRSQYFACEPGCTRPIATNSVIFYRPPTSIDGHHGRSIALRNLLSSAFYKHSPRNSGC